MNKKLVNLIIRLRYHRVNPPLPTPAARSSTSPLPPSLPSSSFSSSSSSRSLLTREFSTRSYLRCVPSNADYKLPGFMSILGIGLRKKGRDTTIFFFRLLAILTTPVSFTRRPLDYRGSAINQVRASEYEMDIECSASISVFSTRKHARSYFRANPLLKTKPLDCVQSVLNKFSLAILSLLLFKFFRKILAV